MLQLTRIRINGFQLGPGVNEEAIREALRGLMLHTHVVLGSQSIEPSARLKELGVSDDANVMLALQGITMTGQLSVFGSGEILGRLENNYGYLFEVLSAMAQDDEIPADQDFAPADALELFPRPSFPALAAHLATYRALKQAGVHTGTQLLALDAVDWRRIGSMEAFAKAAGLLPAPLKPGRRLADLHLERWRSKPVVEAVADILISEVTRTRLIEILLPVTGADRHAEFCADHIGRVLAGYGVELPD